MARINSIVFPAYPNAPKDNQNYGMLSAFADIYVVKIPDDLKKEIETKDIAVYGSPSNVPDDRKKQDLKEILTDATRIPTMCLIYDSEKDITIDGREAHLSEADSRGVIAIQLDEDTIGVIDVFVYNTAGRDEQLYSGRAWDFIDSLDISKS